MWGLPLSTSVSAAQKLEYIDLTRYLCVTKQPIERFCTFRYISNMYPNEKILLLSDQNHVFVHFLST